jgi:hypothetical protein
MPTRLDLAYRQQVAQIRARLERFARTQFTAGEFRDDDMALFVAAVVPVILAGRRQMSALTDAYLSQKVSAATGRRVRPAGPINTDALRGKPATEVYQRPFVTVRAKLTEGLALDAAVNAGLARTSDLVLSDLQLAKTTTTRNTYKSAGVKRYIRVLVGSENCGLCYVASTQTYSTDDLMPIHPGCNCDTDPAPDDFDGSEQLAQTHEAIEQRFGVSDASARDIGGGDDFKDYTKALLVREHGELGPVLTVKSHSFTGPRAI